jgi:hypothetical protein
MLFCYMKCGIQWQPIYEDVEMESVAKFKKSFPANVTTIALTQSLRKQSSVRSREEWSEVCLPH